MLEVDPHDLLELVAFVTEFPDALAGCSAVNESLLQVGAESPFELDDAVKPAVRKLLRHGGFRPSGRTKPASEYLRAAAGRGVLATINPAVDACNVVSLHSGLPVSVVDLDRTVGPLRVRLADANARYVFNASGQELRLDGLLCLFDATGPCANAVKDAQRTKTHDATRRTLSLIWGTRDLPGRSGGAARWYIGILSALGAPTRRIGY